MKDSKEKEHRISNLKDMINNVKSEEVSDLDDVEEDAELIDYLNEDQPDFDDLEIDDEFIYRPGDEKEYAFNLEDNPINEDYIINTPKSEDFDEVSEVTEIDELNDDFAGEISENLDNLINAKIGKTPVLAIVSTALGVILLIISVFIFNSRADRVIDSVASGETTFIVIIFVIIGLLLLIYGLYKIIGFKNPIQNIVDSIDSIEENKKENKKQDNTPEEKIIPKSNIPLDKDSYKIGEFEMDELKSKLKKPTASKPKKIEDSAEAPKRKYDPAKLESETIDDIFSEVEDIDEIPIFTIDSKEDNRD